MSDEPEGEEALAVVEREHEELLKAMAERYTEAMRAADWLVESLLPQTRVFAEAVHLSAGRTAYILVDALRYEMGVDLVRQIDGALDADISTAVSALPSITEVGHGGPAAGSFGELLRSRGRRASSRCASATMWW